MSMAIKMTIAQKAHQAAYQMIALTINRQLQCQIRQMAIFAEHQCLS